MNLHAYTPMTDTVELSSHFRGIPQYEIPTEPMWLLDLRPTLTRYEVQSLARRWSRVLRSPFARDVRRAWDAALLTVGMVAATAVFFLLGDVAAFLQVMFVGAP